MCSVACESVCPARDLLTFHDYAGRRTSTHFQSIPIRIRTVAFSARDLDWMDGGDPSPTECQIELRLFGNGASYYSPTQPSSSSSSRSDAFVQVRAMMMMMMCRQVAADVRFSGIRAVQHLRGSARRSERDRDIYVFISRMQSQPRRSAD